MKKNYRKLTYSTKTSIICFITGIILQLVISNDVLGQNKSIKGTIISSEDGEALPGVTVLLKGTTNGTATNASGNYSLTVPNGSGTLVISFIGYQTQEVPINNQSTINVGLNLDAKSLEEVVVVGYGTQKKETLTGSIVNVEGETLEKNPAISLSNSFAGRLPGVQALNRSGEPGSDVAQLLIRGKSTLGSADPLIVIDGVPGRQGFDQIDPRDIESVSILKDASAAIYGARAANGVILITTKRGKTGKPTISYTFNQGVTTPTRIPEYADSETLAKFQNEQLVAQGQGEKFTAEEIQKFRDGTDPLNYPNTDWVKSTLKDFSTQSRHSLSIRGGTDAVKYFVSGNYSNQEGIFKNGINNFNVLGGRSNIDADITKNFRISLDLSFQEQNRLFPGIETSNVVKSMWRNYPYLVDVYPNGLPGDGVERGDNPGVMATDAAGYRKIKTNVYQTRLSFDLLVPQVQGLGIDGFVAYDKTNDHNKEFNKPYSVYRYNAATDTYEKNLARFYSQPELSERYDFESNLIAHAKIKYDRSFEKHRFNSFVATEFADNKSNYFSALRRNFISTAIDQLYAGGESNQVTDGSAAEFTRRNYFGRLSYGFNEKYLIDLNVRYDGSSAFPKDSRWGFFPGVSVGWILSEEAFMKNKMTFVDHLKIRSSWGKMGNDAINPFQYLSTYSFTNGYFLGGGRSLNKGLTQNVAPNPNITWEVANTTNIGLNAELWNGLFGLTLDVFKTRRNNILTARNASIPVYTGLLLPLENIGIVENKGFEIELSHTNKIGNLTYSIRPNMSFARNKMIFIDEPENIEEWQRNTGHPINTGLYLIPLGIYRSQEQIDNSPHVPGTKVNDLQYQDTNGDGQIDNRDRVRLDKSSTPEINFGTQISMGYKNFDLGILLQGQTNVWRYYWFPQGLFGNVLKEMADNRPTVDNPNSKYPNLTYDNSQVSALNSEFWLRNASFIRLKNVELGYTLPSGLLERIGIKGSQPRIYMNGFNILTLDKLKWFDPEGDSNRGEFYPQNKIFNVGVNVTF
jgi:TonB-linked SusC/RagA family outer membrane protein